MPQIPVHNAANFESLADAAAEHAAYLDALMLLLADSQTDLAPAEAYALLRPAQNSAQALRERLNASPQTKALAESAISKASEKPAEN